MDEPNVDWTAIVSEHKIQEAIEEGKFRNLAGQGKPLDEAVLSTSVFDRLTARLMKDSGALPEWVQLQQDIEREVQQMKPIRERMLETMRRTKNPATRQRIADRLRAAHKERVDLINLMVLKYNLGAPATIPRVFRAYKIKEEMTYLESAIAATLADAEKEILNR